MIILAIFVFIFLVTFVVEDTPQKQTFEQYYTKQSHR